MTGYEEFQQIMSEINRKKELEEFKNKGEDFLNYFKYILGI